MGGLSLDDKPIFAPKWNVNLGLAYHATLGRFKFSPRIDFVYKSSHEFEPVNSVIAREDGYLITNFGINITPPGSRNWKLSFGVQNLSNEQYRESGDSNQVIGYENLIFGRPRSTFFSFAVGW